MARKEADVAAKDAEIAELAMTLANAEDSHKEEKVKGQRMIEASVVRANVVESLLKACCSDVREIFEEIEEIKCRVSSLAEEWQGVFSESERRVEEAFSERNFAQKMAGDSQQEMQSAVKSYSQRLEAKVC